MTPGAVACCLRDRLACSVLNTEMSRCSHVLSYESGEARAFVVEKAGRMEANGENRTARAPEAERRLIVSVKLDQGPRPPSQRPPVFPAPVNLLRRRLPLTAPGGAALLADGRTAQGRPRHSLPPAETADPALVLEFHARTSRPDRCCSAASGLFLSSGPHEGKPGAGRRPVRVSPRLGPRSPGRGPSEAVSSSKLEKSRETGHRRSLAVHSRGTGRVQLPGPTAGAGRLSREAVWLPQRRLRGPTRFPAPRGRLGAGQGAQPRLFSSGQ